MNQYFLFFLLVLVVYRISRLISRENGPFNCLEWWRNFLGKHAAASPLGRTVADLFHCPYCIGIWLALVGGLIMNPDTFLTWMVMSLGIAGGQSLIQSIEDRGTEELE